MSRDHVLGTDRSTTWIEMAEDGISFFKRGTTTNKINKIRRITPIATPTPISIFDMIFGFGCFLFIASREKKNTHTHTHTHTKIRRNRSQHEIDELPKFFFSSFQQKRTCHQAKDFFFFATSEVIESAINKVSRFKSSKSLFFFSFSFFF